MRGPFALLLIALAGSSVAEENRLPSERQADALAILGDIRETKEPEARCYALFLATELAGMSLRDVSEAGLIGSWPEGQADPFYWSSLISPRPSRVESTIGFSYTQLYFDAFGGLSWIIGNMDFYQEDKAFCFELWDFPGL